MKKILVVSAIAALGLTSVAFAGGLPEEMPAVPTAATTATSPTTATSSDIGIYLGIEGGYGITNWKKAFSKVDNDNSGVGRAFLGYDINRYFAAEFGYSYFFNQAKIDVSNIKVAKIKTQAIDLFGKIKAPVVEGFDLYAKLGGNYLMSHLTSSLAGVKSSNANNFNVAYGAGADYYITSNIIANVEWLRFNSNQKVRSDSDTDSKYQPYTDAFMVGLRYKFDL